VAGDAPDPPSESSVPSNLTLMRGRMLYEALAESGFADPRLAKVKADVVVDILAGVPLFRRLDDAALRSVADTAQVAGVSGGQIIIREGTSSEAFYVLLTGTATVRSSDGATHVLRRGESFGELGVLEGAPRTATITADRELWVLKISRKAFADLVRLQPAIGELISEAHADTQEAPRDD
jgi:ATP-binding cassette, subfamily B, bacterial HlyB/CyaB